MNLNKQEKEIDLLVKFFQGKSNLNVIVIANSIQKLGYNACIGSIAVKYKKPIDSIVTYVKKLRDQGWVQLGEDRVDTYPLKFSRQLHLTKFGTESLTQYIDSYKKYKKESLRLR